MHQHVRLQHRHLSGVAAAVVGPGQGGAAACQAGVKQLRSQLILIETLVTASGFFICMHAPGRHVYMSCSGHAGGCLGTRAHLVNR